jgi:hypothetical protein
MRIESVHSVAFPAPHIIADGFHAGEIRSIWIARREGLAQREGN